MSVRSWIIRGLSSALYSARLISPMARAAERLRPGIACPILVFHCVNDDGDPFFPSLPTRVFSERIAHIAAHYRVVSLEELVEGLRRGALPPNALALTFDDGYRDTLTHAAPILAQYELPATVFLATGYIGSPRSPWFDDVAAAFKLATRGQIALGGERLFPLGSAVQRLTALETALVDLKRLPDEERRRAIDRLIADLQPRPGARPKRRMLTWEEVDALRGLGFSVGAHSVTHPILSRLSPERAWEEIRESKRAIEHHLRTPVLAFAYPNGGPQDYTATTTRLVRAAGFTCAVTTRRGFNTPDTSVFELRRGGPWEAHLPTYAFKLVYHRLVG